MSYIGNSPGVASSRVTTTLTATAAQTQFTTQSGYVLGYVDVYLNGAKLVNGADFEAITGTYITLFAGAVAGDVVELISYIPKGLSDGYTKAEADAKFLDVGGDTATGTMNLAVNSLVVGTNQLVTTGGNVGIGTASPTNKLVVSAAGAQGIEFSPANTATLNEILSYNRSGAAYNTLQYRAADHRFLIGTTQSMTLDSAGNLALGRQTATYRADIDGNFRFANTSAGVLSGFFGCNDTGNITLNFGGTTTPNKGRILYSDNADIFAFYTNSTERLRIDTAGNLGVGVTPQASWSTGTKAIQVGSGTALWNPGSLTQTWLMANTYYDQTDNRFEYIGAGTAGAYAIVGNSHSWKLSTGTTGVGNPTTFSDAMTLDSSGRLLIANTGSTGTNVKLNVGNGNTSSDGVIVSNTANGNYPALNLSNWTGSATTQGPRILFDNSTLGAWYIGGGNGVNTFDIATTWGTPLLRLDSSGNLGLGATPSAWASGLKPFFEIGSYAALGNNSGGGGGFALYGNAYEDGVGTYKYKANYHATLYRTYAGQHQWFNAATGASVAGTTVPFSQTMTLDAAGKLLVGSSTSYNTAYAASAFAPGFQLYNTVGTAGFYRYSADADGSALVLSKSRSATIGTQTALTTLDTLGYIGFAGSDGTSFRTGASIIGQADGTPATSSLPGRLLLNTTPSGSVTPVARMIIDNAGSVFISNATTNTNSSKLVVNGTISQTVDSIQYLVVDQSDVGTAPNQIPLNQHLGSMAFQDRESVNFLGGTGALSSLDIAAISTQLNVSATDVFVYDTSKDSDGGAWRKRCQHTSWYNETLNTATRGSRREFPAVAVIVATTSSVTIYDGDSPDLPMWMVFTGSGQGMGGSSLVQSGNSFTIAAINAVLVVGLASNSDNYGSPIINFISEKVVRMDPQTTEGGTWLGTIAERNSTKGYASYTASGGGYIITNSIINDVAITVLPNAPVDTATGLPIPTIAVATDGSVSVINNNGTVTNFTNSPHRFTSLAWMSPTRLFVGTRHVSGVVGLSQYILSYPSLTLEAAEGYNLQNDGVNWSTGGTSGSGGGVYTSSSLNNEISIGYAQEVVAYRGLNRIAYNTTPNDSLVTYITTKYNTGWMPGDIKGAWLSDTTQEAAVGANLIPNGTSFAGATGTTPPTGWTSTGASYTASANVLSITCSAGSNVAATILLTGLIPNKTYQLSMDASSAGYFRVFGTNHDSVRSISGTRTTQVYNIVTTSTALDINILYGSGGASGTLANVSLRLTDADRSVNNLPLLIYGTVTKTPVAVGSDLVAYSGFSASNYLEQPYNSALDFGTGSFSFIGWVKTDGAQYSGIAEYSRPGVDSDGSILIFQNNDNQVRFLTRANAGAFVDLYSAVTLQNGVWTHLVCARDSIGTKRIYINGVLVATGSDGAINVTSTGNSPRIGFGSRVDGNSSRQPLNGSLALWRVSSTVPSAEQITKMYNDEKFLFQDNSKATLYGTSDAVTAVAYDTDTQLLHVGTSSGRSVFDGLRRIDNTTTAVTTAISAADGLVVES